MQGVLSACSSWAQPIPPRRRILGERQLSLEGPGGSVRVTDRAGLLNRLFYSPPRACPAGAGGPGLRLPKTVDRARRNLKPTPVDPFSSKKKFCWSRPNPFLVACNAILCSRTCSAQPATRWLVGRLSALASRATPPRLALTPRTRRMQRCGRPSKTPTTSAASACSA